MPRDDRSGAGPVAAQGGGMAGLSYRIKFLPDRSGVSCCVSTNGAITAIEEAVVSGETAVETSVLVSVAELENDSARVSGGHCTACMACK